MPLDYRHIGFIRARDALLLVCAAGGLTGALAELSTAVATDSVSSQCWTSSELAARRDETRIQRNVAKAFVTRPVGQLSVDTTSASKFAGRAVRRVDLPEGVKRVALTFDLCEQPNEIAGYQGDIVDYLRANEVKATFFSGGKWLLTHRERASQLIGDPLFEVGSHGWEHRNQQILDLKGSEQEIDGAGLAYQDIYGELKSRACLDRSGKRAASDNAASRQSLFRFPFGACSKSALQAADARGLLAIQWDVSSGDPWPHITAPKMVSNVIRRVRPGSIVLFHANGRGHKTEKALPHIVSSLRKAGYELVTVSELLATPGARIVTSETCYDTRPGDTDHYQDFARRLERAYQRFYRRHSGKPGRL